MYTLSKKELLFDLYFAFTCAKKNKSNKKYVKTFESNLHENLKILCEELYNRTYRPLPSSCFIIKEPKKREIFAAEFRDRIVHHLYYNYTYELFDRTFIEDSYSCRINKGSHYGIKRLQKHIRSESENFTKETFALKMDIKGYFIHIHRPTLLSIVKDSLEKQKDKKSLSKNLKYSDFLDFEFLNYLSKEIILLNPIENCIIKSSKKEWDSLDKSKSLFYSGKDCGLPIGNLTSQLFSNVYLNHLDQFIKRVLKCRRYGRYVDDFYIISQNKKFLKSIIEKIREFLKQDLHLDLQNKKTHIINVNLGVEFLGAFVKTKKIYISNKTVKKMNKHLYYFQTHDVKDKDIVGMVNSYIGVFSHYRSYKIKEEMLKKTTKLLNFGYFEDFYSKFIGFEDKKVEPIN